MLKPGRTEQNLVLKREDGIAMLTVLMLTIILTVIGIAAITTTSLDIKMAGGERLRESSVDAAEACMSSGTQIILQTLANGAIPGTLTGAGANPVVTVNPLQSEIMGYPGFLGYSDSADPTSGAFAPNAVLTVSNYIVNMDIDRLYARPRSGASLAFGAAYAGAGSGAGSGGVEVLYRIDCFASATSGAATAAHLSAVYACLVAGTTCQRLY